MATATTIHLTAGTASLTPHYDPRTDHTVLIVHPDAKASEHFTGNPYSGGTVIGGIRKMRGRWQITAYRDRAHLDRMDRPVYYLPGAQSRAQAAEWLLSWWGHVFRQPHDEIMRLDPFALPASDKRNLFR